MAFLSTAHSSSTVLLTPETARFESFMRALSREFSLGSRALGWQQPNPISLTDPMVSGSCRAHRREGGEDQVNR